ncbi:MAG: hypothetical protein AMQ22_00091 [Candidatus Methanofastidiosum methylothiophilum]|uniref:Uncharacterized protein n=1 Tax=Candidatus Methanofastidiosum methylothiophilum TaxID=1705564 RepID=A0A150J9K8_9EURY|nr:MAG: hypothetical protein AMQ22_00091 [Candidatus Methanofastidiosum methylthiophilus]
MRVSLKEEYNRIDAELIKLEDELYDIKMEMIPLFMKVEELVAEELFFKVADKNFLRVHDLDISWNGSYHIVTFYSEIIYSDERERFNRILELMETCKYHDFLEVGDIERVHTYKYSKIMMEHINCKN